MHKNSQRVKSMFQPTDLDFMNARLSSYERQKIVNYNYFCYKYPNIFKGKTFIRIRYNNSLAITNNPMESIKVDWCATKDFCSTIHCQKRLPNNGICDENSSPQLFKSGNSTVVACQAGCFENFAANAELKGPFLLYSEKQSLCLLQIDHFFGMAIDPYLRTDIHPNPRIDTIGTGFDIDYENTYTDYFGNETYKYKLNKFYCDDFKLEFNGKSCKPSAGEVVAELFFSRVLYKAFQYGTRFFTTGVQINEKQDVYTGPVDKSMTPMTKDEWRNDIQKSYYINPDVTLKDLGMNEDNYKLLIWTTEGAPMGKLIVAESVYKSNSILHNSGVSVVDFLSKNLHRPNHLQFRYNGVRLIDEYEFLGIYSYIQKELAYKGKDEKIIEQQILDFLKNDLPEIGISVIAPAVLQSIIKRYISLLKRVQSILSYVNISILRMTKNIFIQLYTPIFTRAIGKLIVTASRFIVSTLSGVLLASTILGLIDLFALGSDPYNLNKLIDEKFVDNYSEMTIRGIHEMFNVGEVEMSPIFYAYYLNNGKTVDLESENLSEFITVDTAADSANYPSWAATKIINSSSDPAQDILWTTKHLKSLVYNSNNLKIDWDYDSVINVNDINEEELLNSVVISYKEYLNGQEYKLRELKILFYVSITILPFLLFLNFKIYIFVLFLISPLIIFQIYYPITLHELLSH